MKINYLTLVLISALLLLPGTGLALSLEELQQSALANRALVKKYQTEIEKSAEQIRVARSGYYPSLEVGYRTYAVDEASPTEQRENSVVSGLVKWNLFTGFSDKYSIQSAETIKEVEIHRLKAVEQDLQLNVALSYLAVFNQQDNLKVAGDTYRTLEGLYKDSQERFAVGLLDKNGVLKFKVDYDNANLAVQKAEADLLRTLHNLSRAIDQDITIEQLGFAEFRQPPIIDDKADYQMRMLANRSELKALEGLMQSASYMVEARQGEYYPELDLLGGYRNYDDSLLNGAGEFSDEELRAELVLSYNLFHGFKDEAEIAKAKSEVRSLNYDIEELKNDFTTELKNLFVSYEIALENVDVAREDITYAEENLRITELKYKEGLQTQLDLLDSVSNLSRAQSNYVGVVRTVFENYFRIIRMVEGFAFTS